MGLISVRESRELLATVLAIKASPAELRAQLRAQTRAVAGKEWDAALRSRPASPQQSATLVQGSRVRASDQAIVLVSASSKRKVGRGGLVPFEDGKGFEFGTSGDRVATYRGRRGSKRFKVKRHATRQLPGRSTGLVVYPAFAEYAPKILALWVQTTIRTIAESMEGKR